MSIFCRKQHLLYIYFFYFFLSFHLPPSCLSFQTDYYQECNCHTGWGSFLCDEELNYCEKNHDVCQNGGTCKSLPKDDGNFECQCMPGYFGQRYEDIMGLPLD